MRLSAAKRYIYKMTAITETNSDSMLPMSMFEFLQTVRVGVYSSLR